MDNIAENNDKIKKEISSISKKDVSLISVSKGQPEDKVISALKAGQRIFGENKVQELVET